ncbi:MAG: oligoendopeptidase F, partial [Xanthobacteraceae bacterium]|nr:oligoendopeptidase F [Xanthobacteraceae bacterium]
MKIAFENPASSSASGGPLGALPEWNLSDLYAGIDDPKVQADLLKADADSIAFEKDFKGKLEDIAKTPAAGATLGAAVRRYEEIDDLMGRLVSFAGLVRAQNTTDPKRGKFYGDVIEKITGASSHLLFFTLELNRIDDSLIERALEDPIFGHYRPWVEDTRREKPYQLEDRIELLFHEKSVTGRGAWNRLFDETIADLRFEIDGERLSLEPTLTLLQDADEIKRAKAAGALAHVFKENLSTFALVTNVLAKDKEISDRWRGFEDIADSRHLANRVEREVVDALVEAVRASFPIISHRYYKMKAKWFGKERLEHWDRNAPLPKVEQRTIAWPEA